jgi:protein-glucosylgalactosylhydroxylysine glucosidase
VRGVVGPDELTGPVNDDAYTNALAGEVLKAVVVLSQEIGEAPGAKWSRIASSVYLPTSTAIHPNSTVHLENDRCREGQMIEQDDVGLLQYPLGLDMPRAIKAADLAYYQGVTDANGFYTGDSSYSKIGAARTAQFNTAFFHLNGHPSSACNTSKPPQGPCLWSQYNPFLVWKERANYGGHVNFLTGAGGFLQNLLQGYAEIRARMTGFAFDPVLPPYVDMIRLVGVKYAGATFSVAINVSTMVVELTASSSAMQLVVAGKAQAMVPLVPMAHARQPFVVQVVA